MASDLSTLAGLHPGSHVCWVVSDDAAYRRWTAVVLREAEQTNEKPVLFGPEGSHAPELARLAVQVADPRTAFLAGGPLVPGAMYSMFHEQAELARAEGYAGLRVVADMDWLLPAGASTADVIGFELLLDRHARDLGATIVCAYRTDSFDTRAISGAACVHPLELGRDEPAQFRIVAGDAGSWRLIGEVDVAVALEFSTAIATVAAGGADVDATGLAFIDVANMRSFAIAARASGRPIRVLGAPPVLRKSWKHARFDEIAPDVALVG